MAQSKLSTVGFRNNKRRLDKAYKDLLEGTPHAEEEFYKAILYFAKSKLGTALFDFSEGDVTNDDEAQEIALYVWSKLDTLKGGVTSFYPWLNRICYTRGAAAANNGRDRDGKRVELFFNSGDDETVDNPVIFSSNYRPVFQRELPDFIQGTDLKICMYIREGYDYKEIARVLEVTEDSIEIRIRRMRKKIMEMKNA